MKRPGPTTAVTANENSSSNNITYSIFNKPAATIMATPVSGAVMANNRPIIHSPLSSSSNRNGAVVIASPRSRTINTVTFRTSDAQTPPDLAAAAAVVGALPAHQLSTSPYLLRYRRGTSLMSLNSSSMSSQDVKSLRDALVRHDASLSRAGAAVSHLRPVDRNALTARSHFRADPNTDVLAQHLKWSTTPTALSGNPGFAEAEVLAAAREAYHPIAPPVPQMQISIKQIVKTSGSPQSSLSPSPTPKSQQPVLLLEPRSSTSSARHKKTVSIENRPATTAGTLRQQQHPSSAQSSASTTRILPGSADLRKQFDVYQRGTSFLPHQSTTKYFYKPEHGWLVKSIRERRTNNNNNQVTTANGNNSNDDNNATTSLPQQPQLVNNNNSAEMTPSNLTSSSPQPEQILSSRSANISTRLSHQQQRLISVNKAPSSAIPHVTVVDLNAEHDNVIEGSVVPTSMINNNAENPLLKIVSVNTGAVVNPLRTSVMTKKLHQQQQQLQQQQAATSLTINIAVGDQQQPQTPQSRAVSSGPQQIQQMMVTSQQHPAAMRAKKLRDLFASYEDFKRAAEDYASNFPKLPQDLTSSPYLNEAKQRQIWCWLHYGESISDVEYLLSVC